MSPIFYCLTICLPYSFTFSQHLRNSLAVLVYEAHGRAALEYGDLAEFNQCQTQLHAMYADRQPGCVAEFTAYKVCILFILNSMCSMYIQDYQDSTLTLESDIRHIGTDRCLSLIGCRTSIFISVY
jgi:hypothetical protein